MPLPSNFFLLILIIRKPCHSNLAMISSLSLKCQGRLTLSLFENLALLKTKFRDEIPCFSSSGGTKMSNLSNNISSLVNDKKVKEANIDLIERSKHVPLRLTLEERKLLRLCEAALGQTHDMFSQIVRIRNYEFFHKYF